MPQISHSRRSELFRNVHATQAISPVLLGGPGGIGGEGEGDADVEILSLARFSDDDGRELDKECDVNVDLEGMLTGAFIEARGTPQREQTKDAEDASPIGLRLLQTSHSQYSTSLLLVCLSI